MKHIGTILGVDIYEDASMPTLRGGVPILDQLRQYVAHCRKTRRNPTPIHLHPADVVALQIEIANAGGALTPPPTPPTPPLPPPPTPPPPGPPVGWPSTVPWPPGPLPPLVTPPTLAPNPCALLPPPIPNGTRVRFTWYDEQLVGVIERADIGNPAVAIVVVPETGLHYLDRYHVRYELLERCDVMPPTAAATRTCTDCNGKRIYEGAGFLPPEPCRLCRGAGKI